MKSPMAKAVAPKYDHDSRWKAPLFATLTAVGDDVHVCTYTADTTLLSPSVAGNAKTRQA